jgi:hypothetical protein
MLELLRLVLGLPLLAILLYVPGAVTLNSMERRSTARHLFSGVEEWLFGAILISFLTTGLAGFVLAELGMFNWWLLLLVVLLVSLVIALNLGQVGLRWRVLLSLLRVPPPYPQRAADKRMSRFTRFALLGVLLLAVGLFARPAEMLRGALDSGAYINAGVAMSRSGSILLHDQLMRQLDRDKGEVNELLMGLSRDRFTVDTLRMPAFYVYDKPAALVLPQHYSLYPVWIALMHSLFGIWGALYATPLLALMMVFAVYFFARRTFSEGAALAGLLLLVLCPVTIWFARYPVSEVITGLLFFAGAFAFLRMYQLSTERPTTAATPGDIPINEVESRPERWAMLWGVVSAVALGQLALARPDFPFYLAVIPAYLLYWRLARRWHRPYTWFAGALLAMMLLYAVHLSIYSYIYTLDLYHNVILEVRRRWGLLLLGLYSLVLVLVVMDRQAVRLRPFWLRLQGYADRYRWVWAGAIVLAVGAFAFYRYFVSPWQPNVRFNDAGDQLPQLITTTWESYIGAPVDEGSRYNLLRLGWYLSPVGMVLGVVGLLRWVWDRLSAATWLFFGSFLIASFIFIQETYTVQHYIYTMRRYVPIILPALILGIAWLCHYLWTRRRLGWLGYAAAGVVVLGMSAFFIYTSRVIIAHVEERGAVAQIAELASRFNDKTVLLFSNERDEPYVVATPLQYVHGINSFVLARTYPNNRNDIIQGVIERWRRQGYDVKVLLGANGGKLDLPDYTLKPEGYWEYRVPEFEQLRTQKPSNPYESFLPWGIYSIEPRGAAPAWPFRVDIGDMDYEWLVAGFNKQERDSPQTPYWRWTGQQAILRVPWPTAGSAATYSGGTVKLRLRPETPVPGKPPLRTEPLQIELTLDGTRVGIVSVPPGTDFAEYTIHVPAGTPRTETDPGYALLGLKSPTWSGLGAGISGDARALGVQVDAVEIGP